MYKHYRENFQQRDRINEAMLKVKREEYRNFYYGRPNDEKTMKNKMLIFSVGKRKTRDQYVNVFKDIKSMYGPPGLDEPAADKKKKEGGYLKKFLKDRKKEERLERKKGERDEYNTYGTGYAKPAEHTEQYDFHKWKNLPGPKGITDAGIREGMYA